MTKQVTRWREILDTGRQSKAPPLTLDQNQNKGSDKKLKMNEEYNGNP